MHTFTYSKSIIETIKKGVKYTTTTSGIVLLFLLLTFTIFHTFFSVSIVDFEQLNVSWVGSLKNQLYLQERSEKFVEGDVIG